MIACVIPARGGSKGIPRKNVIPVGGRPLIHWSIEQALGSVLVDQVIVATEDAEIAQVARSTGYVGVTVFPRSAESASDTAPTEMVLREVVAGTFENAECIVLLQPTSPLRQPDDIDKAIMTFRMHNADSLFSARRIEGYTWSVTSDGLVPRDGERKPRQLEQRKVIEENGSIYIFTPSVLRRLGRLGGKIVPYYMHPLDSFQIDTPADIGLIETILEARYAVRNGR